MAKEVEKSLGDAQTRLGDKQKPGSESDTASSLGDSQTLIGGLSSEAEALGEGLELTDLSTRYTIVKKLGQGGMGEVLLARDNRLKRQVAIKRIRGEQARSRAAVQRFLTEAQAIAALNHPNIVQVYDYGRDQEGPFLIMEYVDGQSLLERCKDNPLPVEEAVELTCDLLGGLGRAHELGIIHRDIKPANILLTKDGRPKLTDFGLAKQTTADHGQTVTGAVLGTIDFMPPEQRRDATLVDARSDLWSLAATLYQMLTGKSPKVIRLDLLTKPMVRTLGQALEESPAERFQSAAEFRDALRQGQREGETSSSELIAGHCPECGTRNSETVRFCKDCSAPLKVPCFSCEAEIPIWDKGCTACGARQMELLDRRRTDLQKLQADVERLREAGRLGDALQRLESAGELRHPRLQDFQHWLERVGPDLREQAGRLVELASSGLAESRAHRAAWDYPAAIRTLKSLPPEAAGDEHKLLLSQLQADWSEVQQTLQEVQQRVKAKQLDGLLPLVQRAVQLRGDRDDLKKLLGQLEQREARLAAAPPPAPAVDPLRDAFDLPSSGGVTLPGFLGKQPVRRSPLQQHRNLIAAGAAGLVLLFVAGWLLARGGSESVKAATAAPDSLSISEPDAAGIKSSAGEASPASKTPADSSQPGVSVFSPPSSGKASSPEELINSIGMKLKRIAAGRFMMGEGSQAHEVTLTKPFYLGVYEVTQEQYQRVMNANPSRFRDKNNPVEMVSWDDAVSFCRKLSELPEEKRAGRVYRLPTEAEWEYACRANSNSKYSFGDDRYKIEDYAWYSYNSQNKPHQIGLKKPNTWGVYDLHGNVWEWCSDGYEELRNKPASDPLGAPSEEIKVNRGGGWSNEAGSCRSACRFGLPQTRSNSDLGFRIAVNLQLSGTALTLDSNVGKVEKENSKLPLVDAKTFNGHAYKAFPQQVSWKEAKAQCEAMGGHLIIIDSKDENALAATLLQNMGMRDSWLGITDEAKEGAWISVKGAALSYTNWYKNQPSNGAQEEHYGILSNATLGSGESIGWKWCDQANRAIQLHNPGYICEWDREPQKK